VNTRILVAFVAGLWAAPAFAQGTSDLQPSAPAPPPGGNPYAFQPGMPLPTPAGAAAAEPGAAGAAPARGAPVRGSVSKAGDKPAGRVITDDYPGADDRQPEGSDVGGGGDPTGQTHVVKKGDTLWDISATYFRSPFAWPKLWAFNPSITNPHWIYPGDIVRLSAPGAMPVAATPEPPPADTGRKVQAPTLAPATGLFLRQTGFVEPGELEQSGKILASREEKLLLATLDEAYVEFNKSKPLRVGERYTIYREMRQVKHPTSKKRLGDIVQIFGEVEVKSITEGNIARVLIIDSLDPIERGFRVGPLRRQFKMVEPRPDDQDLAGLIVATLYPRKMVGNEMLVFIDRGKKDGVVVGNRFLVVRRGDGYQPLLASGPVDDRRFPRETVAEMIIIDVRESLSTGFVQRAIKEARIGDRVEARKGF
jgi:hypothetical protein